MSKAMIDLIRSGQIKISRFGEGRNVTVLFCDLAGFTSISEAIGPEQLVEFLNDYLDSVVSIVFEQKGYVDKFIGDAVMAVWNAPLNQSDHTSLALSAAIEIIAAIQKINTDMRLKFSYVQNFSARVGLHTGPAIVGNIGAKVRHNYTVIGDTVNLASRLEGSGKAYDCYLIFSEDVRQHAPEKYNDGILEVDQIAVKGRSSSTRIYTYLAQSDRAERDLYLDGLKDYYAGDFEKAVGSFERAGSIPPSREMKKRCEAAIRGHTPPQWKKGVWHFDEK